MEHTKKNPGEHYDFHVLEEVQPNAKRTLDVAEEDWIRAGGGPKSAGGRLENGRYQMNEKDYAAAGGTIPKPTN